MGWAVERLRGLGVRSKSERFSETGAYRHRTRGPSDQPRSASRRSSTWTLIIEVPLHRAARGGSPATIPKQPSSPVRAILIVAIATVAVLGTFLLVLWVDAVSTGTVPL